MITSNEMSPADIAAVTNNGNGNNGLWGGGDGAWWLIVLFLFAFVGGNGFGGWGGNANAGGGAVPYIMNTNTGAEVQRGFDQAAVMSALGDINVGQVNGFAANQQAMCSGFSSLNNAVTNGFSQAEIAANARQMADMQQSFNSQIATMQAMNALQASVNQCCCDNRAATADLKYTVATEACADRAAVGDALQAVTAQGVNNTNLLVTTMNAGFQSIKDQMCQDKIDAKDDLIAQLRSELMFSRGQSSQDVQTATISAGQANIMAGQRALANEIEQYVNPTPRPAYIVQNPNGCNCGTFNTGCGTF